MKTKTPYQSMKSVKVLIDLKQKSLNPDRSAWIHFTVYNHIRDNILCIGTDKSVQTIVAETAALGEKRLYDEVIGLTNLYFMAFKNNRNDIMEAILKRYSNNADIQKFIKTAYNFNDTPYIFKQIVKFDLRESSKIRSGTYNHIRDKILCAGTKIQKDPNSIIIETMALGGDRFNDQVIAMTNLFSICVKHDKTDIMEFIMNKYEGKKNIQFFIANAYDGNYTPIMNAVYNGRLESVKLLVVHGAKLDIINNENENLLQAADAGLRDALKKKDSLLTRNRYEETKKYITSWIKKNQDKSVEELTDAITFTEYNSNENYDDNVSASAGGPSAKPVENLYLKDLSPDNIEELLTSQLDEFYETQDVSKITKVFIEINNIIKQDIVQSEIIKTIIEPYTEFLMESFSDVYSILKLNKEVAEVPIAKIEAIEVPIAKIEAIEVPIAKIEANEIPIKVGGNQSKKNVKSKPDKKALQFKVLEQDIDYKEQIKSNLNEIIEDQDADKIGDLFKDINILMKNNLIKNGEVKVLLHEHHDTIMSEYYLQALFLNHKFF